MSINKVFFVETIPVKNGIFLDLSAHLKRMEMTSMRFYGEKIGAEDILQKTKIPVSDNYGMVKCRILYGASIQQIEFEPYRKRQIKSLKLVTDENIDYSFKYADRFTFSDLLRQKGDCDDILIVRAGYITDTSYSNVVLFDGESYYTPDTYLLNGVRRQQLLVSGKIKERRITSAMLPHFDRIYLINSMLDIEDDVSLPVTSICF